MKNNQKETINISLLNKNDKSKTNDSKNNNVINISEDKNTLPKITLKKDSNDYSNNSRSNNMLNQKRERTQSNNNNKDMEEDINNNIEDKKSNNNNNNLNRKKTVTEAKKEMKDFELLIINTEKELQNKYGIVFPDLSFEDNLPDDIKNKLIDDFLESPKIQKLLNEANNNK